MNYPFILKFSNISNLSDARFAAGTFADFLGFCFDPSLPAYIEPRQAKEITGWINGPLLTGEFGQQPLEWIKDFVDVLSLQAIQIPADYQDNRVLDIGLRLIIKVDKAYETDIMKKADMFITSDQEIYAWLKSLYDKPVIFAFDVDILKADDYDGIDLKGIKEDRPGTRNHSMWNEILEPYME